MFWQPLFWGLLVPCLIVLGIMYGTTKKVFKLFYVLSLFVYIIAVAYIIDVFTLNRNWILGLLTFSAVLMIVLAYWLSKKGDEKPSKTKRANKKSFWIMILLLVVMVVVIVVSSLDVGVTRTITVVDSVERAKLIVAVPQEMSYNAQPSVDVATFSYTNGFFLPIVVEDQYFLACWYDTATQTISSEQLQTQVNGQFNEYRVGNEPMAEVPSGGSLALKIAVTGAWYYETEKPLPAPSYDKYDAIVLATFNDQNYVDCSRLAALKDDASKIASYNIIPLK